MPSVNACKQMLCTVRHKVSVFPRQSLSGRSGSLPMQVVQQLLSLGAEVNAKNSSGRTALHYAVREQGAHEFVNSVTWQLACCHPSAPQKPARCLATPLTGYHLHVVWQAYVRRQRPDFLCPGVPKLTFRHAAAA